MAHEANASLTNGHTEPHYGSRLLPQVVDELAESNPSRVYAIYPFTSDLSKGFRHVTMGELAQAVNKVAFWLDDTTGRSTTFETIAYMGPSDIRYTIFFLAAIKCGYKLLLPSPRNAVWMNIHLLQSTDCRKFFCATQMEFIVQDLKQSVQNMAIYSVESLDNMLDGASKRYPYEVTYKDACWDPILVLQSSGSTGPPKPIETSHATWAVADRDRDMPLVEGRRNQNWSLFNFSDNEGLYFAAFPPFHLGGTMCLTVIPIYSTMATVVLGPADKPPVGHLAGEIMLYHKLKAIFAPPSVFEQLILESQALELMKDLEFLLYAGGPLSENTGGILSKMTNVCQFYGSTETNGIPTLLAQREDWAYLEFHPFAGVEMRPSDDDAFELILHNDPQARESRSFSCNYPNIEEYQSRDLFKPHPTKPHLWRFHGRKDDIIVLSNSAKINPVPSEAIITGHPLVSAALVVGFGRLQPALLLEPMPEVELAISALIDEIWPTIQYANQQARDYGRIVRAMIVVANVNKSFERAGKGTVMRKMTTEKFASEIEALYSDLDQPLGKSSIVLTRPKELSQVKHFVSACVNETFKVPELGEREDIFVRGLDSIGSIAITRSIKAGFPMSDKSWLSVQTLYAHPSIEKLAEVVYHKLNLESSTASQANGIETPRIAEISASVAKYTKTLTPKLNVLLTGSTGSLGTRILSNLITSPRIGQITCLNRSSNASARQQKTFMALDFQHELSEVSFITASLSSTRLGISDESYDALVATADIIIHNAWPVNFTHTFATFEPHLIGIRNLIDFNLQSKKNPRIIFVSSASSVSNYHHVDRSASAVPEHLVTNHVAPAHMGYAESKYVAECILGEAARQCDVLVSILRVGQIAGVVSGPGIWSKNEWIYAMLKSSKTLRCLPTDLEHVDWVPVDTVAKFVMDIVASQKDVGAKLDVMNVVNPHPVPWSQFVPAILARLGQEEVKAVPMSEWVNRLERAERESDVQNKKVLDELPALKIIDFFRMVAQPPSIRLATDMARARSKTLSNLEPVSEAWMDIWLERWGL